MLSLAFMLALVAWAKAEPARAQSSEITPYQRNPLLFSTEAQAFQALNSADILMRRSAVEWLGRWTATDGASTFPGAETDRASLQGRRELVPALIRGVREMPEADSIQAVSLLALIGPDLAKRLNKENDAFSSPVF